MPVLFSSPARPLSPSRQRCRPVAPRAGKGFGAAKPKKVSKKEQELPHYARKNGTCPCGSGNSFKVRIQAAFAWAWVILRRSPRVFPYEFSARTHHLLTALDSDFCLQSCCGPIISGVKEADTAEELMRSRFSAYCLRQVKYIVETTHPESASFKGSWYNGKQVSTLQVCSRVHAQHSHMINNVHSVSVRETVIQMR